MNPPTFGVWPCPGVLVETKALRAGAGCGANSSPVISHHLPPLCPLPPSPPLVNLKRVLAIHTTHQRFDLPLQNECWPVLKILKTRRHYLFAATTLRLQSYFIQHFVQCIKLNATLKPLLVGEFGF